MKAPSAKRGPEDPREAERVTLLREAMRTMEKTLRAFSIYAEGHEIIKGFLKELTHLLSSLVEEHGDTWIEVKATALHYGEHEVYREEPDGERFVFGLHRDGIRRLCLMPGLTGEEVARLARVIWIDLDSPQHFDSDRVTLLWDAELENVRYIVAEVLAGGEEEGADLDRYKVMMNDIIASATNTALPPGYTAQRDEKLVRVSTHALADIAPEQIAQTLAIAGDTGSVDPYADKSEPLWILDLQTQYIDPTVLVKFTEILFRGLARHAGEERPAPLATFELLFKALAKKERFADLLRIANLVRSAKESPRYGSPEAAERLFGCLLQGERILQMVRGLEQQEADHESIKGLLALAPPDRCADVVRAGAELVSDQGRNTIIDLLVEVAADRPETAADHLRSSSLTETWMAFQALIRVGTPAAIDALTTLRHNPAPNMRLELLRATEKSVSTAIRKARVALLQDDNSRVRAEAERCLARHGDPELIKWLYRRVNDGELLDCSFVEKRRVCELLATSGGPRDRQFLSELVQQGRKPFIRQRQLELCAAAAFGLAATGDLEYVDLLKKEASRRLTNRLIRNSCRQALVKLKETRQRRRVKSSSTRTSPVGAASSQERRELERAPTLSAHDTAQPEAEATTHEFQVEAGGLGPAPSLGSDAATSEPPLMQEDRDQASGTDYGFVDLESSDSSAGSALPPLVPPEPPPAIAAGGEEDGIDLPDPMPADGSKSSQEIDALLHTFLEDKPGARATADRPAKEKRERRPPTQRAVEVVKEQDAMNEMVRRFVDQEGDEPKRESDGETKEARPARQEPPDGEVDDLLRGYLESVD